MISLSRFDMVSLRLFVAVVDAGSLTGGANRFGISLPAASKRIAELEHHCGSVLLERSKRGVLPTAAGEMLHRHAIDLVFGLEQLAVALDEVRGHTRGQVRLFANTSAVNGFLPALLAAFRAEQPNLRIDLAEALSTEVVDAVSRGAAELGVFPESTPAAGLDCVVCDEDALVLAVPVAHPLAGAERLRFAQTLDLDFVGLSRSTAVRRLISAAADAEGRALRVPIQVHSFDAMCRMVAAGLAVGVLPRAAALPHAASMGLALVAIEEPWARRRLLLGARDRSRLGAPARALAALIERRALSSSPAAPDS